MRRVLRLSQESSRDGDVLVKSTTELDREEEAEQRQQSERISTLVKKPFRCLVGGSSSKQYGHPDLVLPPDDDQYIPPGAGGLGEEESAYGFEAIVQDGKKKRSKSRSFRNKQQTHHQSTTESRSSQPLMDVEELPPPSSSNAFGQYYHPSSSSAAPIPILSRSHNRSFEDTTSLNRPTAADQSSLNLTYNSFPSRNRSFEDMPPGSDNSTMDALVRRSGSFADVIPPGKKNDPLDYESIRDVQKALREMERKLQAADTQGKRVSRTKVMKALLTVVDQLDQEYNDVSGAPFPTTTNGTNSNNTTELYHAWAAGGGQSPPMDKEAIERDRERRNMMQMRELTITPNKDCSGRNEQLGGGSTTPAAMRSQGQDDTSPWKGDKPSFSNLEVKPNPTAETEVEQDYISSSSDDEDEEVSHFTGETGTDQSEGTKDKNSKSSQAAKAASQKGSFAHAVYDEEGTMYSHGTPDFRKVKKQQENSPNGRGGFPHQAAVTPNGGADPTSPKSSSNFDIFNLDMKDPAVQDALSDLLWIPSPSQTKNVESSPAAVASPDPSQPSPATQMRKVYREEEEYYDKPDVGDQSTATMTEFSSHTGSSSVSHHHQQPPTQPNKPPRENSWWRRNRPTLKPSSKDTPNVQEQPAHHHHRGIQTRVTVTQNDDNEPPSSFGGSNNLLAESGGAYGASGEPWRTDHRWTTSSSAGR